MRAEVLDLGAAKVRPAECRLEPLFDPCRPSVLADSHPNQAAGKIGQPGKLGLKKLRPRDVELPPLLPCRAIARLGVANGCKQGFGRCDPIA